MASTSPSSDIPQPNWLDLPPEVTADILRRLGTIEIPNSVRMVCATWRSICKDPSMWRSIDIRSRGIYDVAEVPYDPENMCRYAVDLSCGLLEEIRLHNFYSTKLLHYIADRSPQLRSLRVAYCYYFSKEGLGEVAKKLPKLEELHLFLMTMPTEALESFGRFFPQLKSLTYNRRDSQASFMEDVGDKEAQAIARTMPELRHLSLFGNQMTNNGLQAILNGCPLLESFDMRHCFNVDLSGDLGRLCAQRIKILRRPSDSTVGYEFLAYEFLASIDGDSSSDDELASAISDMDFLSEVYEDYEFSDGGGSDMSSDYDGLSDC